MDTGFQGLSQGGCSSWAGGSGGGGWAGQGPPERGCRPGQAEPRPLLGLQPDAPRPVFQLSQDRSTAGSTSRLPTHVPRAEAGQMNAPPPPTGPAEEAASHGLPGPCAPPTSITSCSWTLQPFPLTPSSAPHSSGRKGTLAVGWQKDHLQRSCKLPGKAQPVQREATCWGLRVQSHQHPQHHWAPRPAPPRPACSPPLCAVNSLWRLPCWLSGAH